MAENRNITWRVTLKADREVSTVYRLSQVSNRLEWGKWTAPPPTQISVTDNQPVIFRAAGRQHIVAGTQGTVIFESSDSISTPTRFIFRFDIPYYGDNSGGVSMENSGNENYSVVGGIVPPRGWSVIVDVTITQIAPIA